jgi:hypothetical protein
MGPTRRFTLLCAVCGSSCARWCRCRCQQSPGSWWRRWALVSLVVLLVVSLVGRVRCLQGIRGSVIPQQMRVHLRYPCTA